MDLTRLCWFDPDFVMDIEHSDEDLVALFAQLSGSSDIAKSLNPGMFRSNPSHQGAQRALHAKHNYSALYTAEDVARMLKRYRWDFTAFGYSPDLDCV